MRHYSNIFKPTEICMMLASFSNMETIHIAAYSYLLDTIGMPDSEYHAFLKYDAMRKKYEYMLEFEDSTTHDKNM
ncbi:ribonucleoside-diphosphate reductase, beta subunit, putative [Wolbachia endosymbiont of Drosophila ananassae]|nr:ribonucleoside-diphosphate reductase, beta subunit, putative [Wolbachia endosymbiont of Drosophila ananassae]